MKLPTPAADSLALLCLPHAGARASAYRDWADELPSTLQALPLDYPRRADATQAPDSVATLADRLQSALSGWPAAHPVALFGHSLGALVAFELALRMTLERRPPLLLLVSGHRAPQERPREAQVHQLPSPALRAWAAQRGGVPRALRDDAAVFELFEPALREDLRLAETWQPPAPQPLPCPIVALSGLNDALAPPESMAGWREHTRTTFRQHALPGGHFFLLEQRPQFLALLALEIERCHA
jgi:surfactin synthase thioesterase subunit